MKKIVTLALVLGAIITIGFASYSGYVENVDAEKPTELTVKTPGEPTDVERRIIRAAVGELFNGCGHLEKYVADIDRIEASIHDTRGWGHYYETYGWPRYVVVDIKINDDPTTIPNSYRAWGHTLHYYLGGGDKPGIVSKKRQTQNVCGSTPVYEGKDSFLAWTALADIGI